MCEAEAVQKAKNGDVAGYEALYTLYRARIYSLYLRRMRNASDAEDLTQEVFMQVYRKIDTFRGEATFKTWLYRIAQNFLLMCRRQRCCDQISLSTLPEEELWARHSRASAPAQRLALRQAVSSLSRPRKNVVLLHDVEGYTHREVARRLGITISASRSCLHRAHLTLRNSLHREGDRQLVWQRSSSSDFRP
jgi:RNA polymerase sigma-70 factor, ECF subfamily